MNCLSRSTHKLKTDIVNGLRRLKLYVVRLKKAYDSSFKSR